MFNEIEFTEYHLSYLLYEERPRGFGGTSSIVHNKYKIFDAQSLGTHEDALIFLKILLFRCESHIELDAIS